jgi:hypothetical protein
MMPRYWIDIYKDTDGWWVANVWDTETGECVWSACDEIRAREIRFNAANKVRELLAKLEQADK